uniref:Uncharacterized protein n=1 Tax=Tanacetum cinerariifolium TaxID=118510 RepID=A0A6L2LYS3_TANCI|nr:hypothetical protein [Tanacetum cinerariifolium]
MIIPEANSYGLLVLVLSTPIEDKPFESEVTTFLVMTGGYETVIGFVLALALTELGTCFSSLEVLKGLILNIPGAITVSFFTTFDSCGMGTEFQVTRFDKACVSPTLGIPTGTDEFPLPEDFPTASEEMFPLLRKRDATAKEVCTANEDKEMEHSNPTLAKIPILDTRKFKQWKFRIQHYLQNEHYALWEVIEFGDSYEAPKDDAATGSAKFGDSYEAPKDDAATGSASKTTLLLALLDEHQLRFNKYKTAQELWAAILKTFGRNEATRKTKKNLLKQQYGNFKAKRKETLDQTFNKLQAIVSHMEFMYVEIEQDDLNQKLLTSLASEWLMHTIVWRNRSDLDTISLDDLYNHLKVYEPEVQKKSDSQNMAFISSAKNISGNGEVNTASIPTASTQVSPASANVAAASISLDTACAYIASQSNASQLKYKDINHIDEDDIKEMDIN